MTATHRGAFCRNCGYNKSIVLEACNIAEVRARQERATAGLFADNAKLLQQLGVLSLPKATAAG